MIKKRENQIESNLGEELFQVLLQDMHSSSLLTF